MAQLYPDNHPRKRNRPIEEDIKYEECYGQNLSLWIYAPKRKEWVTVDSLQPGFTCIPYDITNERFLSALSWINLGAFFFPYDYNPNMHQDISPVYLPPEYLEKHGIRQENLMLQTPEAAFMSYRSCTQDNQLDRAKARLAEAQEKLTQAAKTPLEKAVEELTADFQPIANYRSLLLTSIKRKYLTELSEDGTMIRIKQT